MDSRLWERVRTAFERLLDVPEAERGAWIERECVADAALRSRLLRLLEADSTESFDLNGPPSVENLLTRPDAGLAAGTRIGPFVLIEPIAVGGMGTVWLAEQQQPRRRVALKTLRAELCGAEAQKRFRAEAELLAHLSHPGIAQVFGAGTAQIDARALPYIAMEYVEGSLGLCEWADERGLDLRARLRLFVETCAAVHHGHVRGVIHRDLKPNNVLVDPAGHPKVIDFGLARALDAQGLGMSLAHTRDGDILGTLAYMSPEHVGGRSYAVDARSDVYALGCILCELVTGRPPIQVDKLPIAEVARRIAEAPPQFAEVRPVDLRWVLAMTLEKDPARRYASASELAADVQRVLDGWPILARPPSTLYELGKLMRRHRLLLTATTAVLVSLSIGLWQARREARAAEEARGETQLALLDAKAAQAKAEREADLAQTTSQLLNDVFQAASVYDRGREARVVDAIVYAERLLEDVADPTTRAVLASVVGRAWIRLEDKPRGEALVRESIEALRSELPSDDYFRLQAEVALADLLELEQRFVESRDLSLSVLPVLEASLGADHPLAGLLRMNLAVCELRLGRHERAEELFRGELARYESLDDQENNRAPRRDLHHRIGNCRILRLDAEGALEQLEAALALADDAPLQQATLHMDIGRAWMLLGEEELALEEFDLSGTMYAALPPSAVQRFAIASNRAEALLRLKRLEEARGQVELAARALAEGWREPGLRHFALAEQRVRIALEGGDIADTQDLVVRCRELLVSAGLTGTIHEANERVTAARALLAAERTHEAAQAAAAARALFESLEETEGPRYALAGELLERALGAPQGGD